MVKLRRVSSVGCDMKTCTVGVQMVITKVMCMPSGVNKFMQE